jgi:hypothetical protein
VTTNPDFMDRLRVDLVAAAGRRQRRTRPLVVQRRLALVAAVVLVVAGLVAALDLRAAPSADAGVLVTHRSGQVNVELTDLEHRPEVIQAALRRAGLDVRVVAGPAGPSRVGLFLADTVTGTLPVELHPENLQNGSFPGFALPEGWNGTAVLTVGRPAKPGENYVRFSDAYARGEPLYCSRIYGLTAADAVARLPKDAARARFETLTGDGSGLVRLPADQVDASPFASFLVSDAVALSPTDVMITVTADGQPLHHPAASPTRGACP